MQMDKKLFSLLVVILFSAFSLIMPGKVLAGTNKFGCGWDEPDGICLSLSVNGCNPNFEFDDTQCLAFTNPDSCANAGPFACVPSQPHYRCDPNQGCVQDNSGLFVGQSACTSNCPQVTGVLRPTCPDGYFPINLSAANSCSELNGKCCKAGSDIMSGPMSTIGYYTCAGNNGKDYYVGGPPGDTPLPCSQMASLLTLAPRNICQPPYTYDSTGAGFCVSSITSAQWNGRITCNIVNGQPTGVDTAIGCIPVTDLSGFLKFILQWVFGIAGGIILLMVIITGYTILTSSGNPEKLTGAKENAVSILAGAILMFSSLLLLQAVGAGIFKLPGF